MIHYHGNPICGTRDEGVRFITGRHGLVSFDEATRIQVEFIADACQSFVLDNGAFTAWKKGKTLDVDGFKVWVEKWYRHPAFDWALIPDVIDGDEEDNDALLWEWPDFLPGVPVWHMHESLDRLERLCFSYARVALGSSGDYSTPGTETWWLRMAQAMDAICDEDGRPPCKLHGLRMMDPKIFTRLPLASADSTNVVQCYGIASRFGMYPAPSSSLRASVIAERIEHFNSAPCWQSSQQVAIPFQLQPTG